MTMFHILHRLYVLGWFVLVCLGLVWLYPRTGLSEGLADWHAVWKNQPKTTMKPVGEISGTVTKVLGSGSLTLRSEDQQLYNIALLGVVSPPATPQESESDLAKRGKQRLADLVLSNEVQVTLTWLDPLRRGVGVVHVGRTNVNAAMVESGVVQLKREFIKGIPLLDQYAMVRADRLSKEQFEATQ